jgi:hypothetical protein
MSPILLPLYLASFAVIALLSFFAHQNRRAGWVRERNSIFEDLIALQVSWDEADAKTKVVARSGFVAPAPLMGPEPSTTEACEFTRQLAAISQLMDQSTIRPETASHPELALAPKK